MKTRHPPKTDDPGRSEVRFVVDAYYAAQEKRIAIEAQVRELSKSGKASEWIEQFVREFRRIEDSCVPRLKQFADAYAVGRWAQSIRGIGPIIPAALIAHIDIKTAKHPSAVWRFAGLDPTSHWDKGQKRPWNAALKVLCWKIGKSFVMVSSRDDDYYGHVYQGRKLFETERNEAGDYAEQAARELPRYRRDTISKKYYEAGKLSPGHLDARAKRYAVKLFLAHWWTVAYEIEYGVPPPLPWIIERGGHVDYIPPPNWPMEEDVQKPLAKAALAGASDAAQSVNTGERLIAIEAEHKTRCTNPQRAENPVRRETHEPQGKTI